MTSGQTTTPAQPAVSSINGNWDFIASSTMIPGVQLEMGGILTTNGGNVTGTMFAGISQNTSCFPFLEPVPVTGTISTSGQLTLTSSAVNNQVITVTGNLAPGGTSYRGVTYTVANGTGNQAGCAAGDQGTVVASPAFPLSSVYTGNLTSQSTGDVFPATVDISEKTYAFNSAPILSLSGQISVTGSSCFSKAALVPGLTSGGNLVNVVFGNELAFLVPLGNSNPQQSLVVGAFITQGGKVLQTSYAFGGGLCADDTGTGTLIAQ